MTTHSGTRWAVRGFVAQGLLVLGWWVALFARPGWRASFLPDGAAEAELLAFLPADVLLLGVGSWVAAWLAARRLPWALPVAWVVAGAALSSTLHVAAWVVGGRGGELALACMLPVGFFSVLFALDVSGGVVPIFRRARAGSPARQLLGTFVQIVFMWSLCFGLLPWAVVSLERGAGLPGFDFPGQAVLAVALFVAAGSVGVVAGWVMATHGQGTPVPFDGTNALVERGPYACLRNPMVVTGLTQGAAVGLWLGSWGTLAYVLVGGLVWQGLVRPAEEADLARTFGEAYEDYRRRVPCWWPRRPSPSREPTDSADRAWAKKG